MEHQAFWQLIQGRRSVRRYQDRDVPPDVVWRLLEAAHWAPSAHNRQPWRFIVIEKGPLRERIARAMGERLVADLLQDGWEEQDARTRAERSYQRLTQAPVLILLALDTTSMDVYPDERRQRAEHTMMVQSVALAGQNLLLAAHHYGLGACWICAPLFAGDILRALLNLPESWEPQGFITLGYPAERPTRDREPLADHVMWITGDGTRVEGPPTSSRAARAEPFSPLVTVLAGGVGGAKGAEGFYRLLPPDTLAVIVNTGDDFEYLGLPISPDLDTVMYTLAGINHPEQGWGLAGDTFQALEMLARYGVDPWFRIGDKDMGTHVLRRHGYDGGLTLSAVTEKLRQALGVRARILPMSDDPVRTMVVTPEGTLPFQEYFVRRRHEPQVLDVVFQGIEQARPAPGVLDALAQARAVVFAPSNPYLSLDPILSVPGVRALLRERRDRVAAITPIVGGAALKGPAAKMMRERGETPSPVTVARRYADVLGGFVLDERDAHLRGAIEALGIRVVVTDTIMRTAEDKVRVARAALAALQVELP